MFWSRVLAGYSDEQRVVYDRSNLQRLHWVSRCLLYAILRGTRFEPRYDTGTDQMIFQRVLDCAPNKTCVCDSSQDFARLARLIMTRGIDVVPIHLIRDARGVAHSYSKRKRVELGMKRVGFWKALLLWCVVNTLTQIVILCARKRSVRISYDRFCQNPEDWIEFLNAKLDVHIDAKTFLEQINDKQYHNVGGNLLRFNRIESIRHDVSWKDRLPALTHIIATTLTAPLNWIWVYRRAR